MGFRALSRVTDPITCRRARYGLIWLEIAHADYTSLATPTREQISARIEQLLANSRQRSDTYDEVTDQWTTTYGAEHRRGRVG